MTASEPPNDDPIRAVFFGTSDFAAVLLRALCADHRFTVPLVVTQPSKPHGRGLHVSKTHVAREAERLGLAAAEPTRLRGRSFRSMIEGHEPHFLVVASYGRILPGSVLGIPSVAPVNVHASLLPALRGAAPIQRALMEGLDETGVTTMWMDEGIDTGDMLLRQRVPIDINENCADLTMKLAGAGADLLCRTLAELKSGRIQPTPQDSSSATYAPMITADDCTLRWDRPARRVHDQVRALAPRPGATTRFAAKRVKVLKTIPLEGATSGPGVVVVSDRDGIVVGAASNLVRLVEIQPESGRAMPAADWARGARVAPGSAFE